MIQGLYLIGYAGCSIPKYIAVSVFICYNLGKVLD